MAFLATKPTTSFEQKLRQEVQGVPVGGRIPSIRAMRLKYAVGQAAVERAVAKLCQQGLVEVRPKSGIYRTVTTAGPISVIYRSTHLLNDDKGTYYEDFVKNLISELAKAGHIVKFLATPDDQKFASIVRQLNRTHERAVTFALKWNDVETITSQAGASSSFIHVLPNFVESIENAVVLDDREIVRLQVEHLLERGHRAISFLHGYDENVWSRPAFQRYNAFRDLAIEHALDVSSLSLQQTGLNGEKTREAILEIFRQDHPPTAVILNADVCVRPAYDALYEVGREPGKDVAVVSVNNRPWCDYVRPTLTSVDISPQRGAQAVTEVLKKLDAGETVDRQVIEARLVVRASSDFDL
ncbi:MAG: substrate-binding domain-containing protein [Planctomycetota bacterium]